jgi:hypothetical protein
MAHLWSSISRNRHASVQSIFCFTENGSDAAEWRHVEAVSSIDGMIEPLTEEILPLPGSFFTVIYWHWWSFISHYLGCLYPY